MLVAYQSSLYDMNTVDDRKMKKTKQCWKNHYKDCAMILGLPTSKARVLLLNFTLLC